MAIQPIVCVASGFLYIDTYIDTKKKFLLSWKYIQSSLTRLYGVDFRNIFNNYFNKRRKKITCSDINEPNYIYFLFLYVSFLIL